MKKKRRSNLPTPQPHRRRASKRTLIERELGQRLLRGEIPVGRCPVPPSHIKDFDEVCRAYQEGRISEADVQAKVAETLRNLKPAELRGESASTGTSGENSPQ